LSLAITHLNGPALGSLLVVLFVLVHVLGAVASIHALLYTRTSQGAIAWAVSLVAAPYVTLVPYLFLGRRHFSGYVDARRREKAMLRGEYGTRWGTERHAQDVAAHALGAPTVRALTHLSGMPFVAGNHVRLLIDGTATFEAIFEAIDNARSYVLVQFFIVTDDALGRMLSDTLLAATARGVQCYLLYDSIGSFDLPHSYVDTLRAGGVAVHPFATNKHFVNRFQLNFRNHRKIVVVDGDCAFVGGHNVGVEYLGAKPPLSPWRDTHIELRGPVVADIQFVFDEDWHWATQSLPPRAAPPRPFAHGTLVDCEVVPMGPADMQETGSLFFVTLINAARERVWIATPYLVPDEAVLSALKLAQMRGVDVRLLIPSRRDHFVVFEASRLYARELAAAGVRILRYRPGFTHQKVVLVDRDTAAIGSANLDNRSFRLNFEIMVVNVSERFAHEVEVMLEDDFDLAYEVDPSEYARTPGWRRVVMHLARLFSPIL
jgi:cardiolipin synthase